MRGPTANVVDKGMCNCRVQFYGLGAVETGFSSSVVFRDSDSVVSCVSSLVSTPCTVLRMSVMER